MITDSQFRALVEGMADLTKEVRELRRAIEMLRSAPVRLPTRLGPDVLYDGWSGDPRYRPPTTGGAS